MPRYTDSEVSGFIARIENAIGIMTTMINTRVVKIENGIEYDSTFKNLFGQADSATILLPYGLGMPLNNLGNIVRYYVPTDQSLFNRGVEQIKYLDELIAQLKNPTVPSNAPLSTIPPTVPGTTIAAILKRIDATHKSENDALYEIRVRTQEIKSFVDTINTKVERVEKNTISTLNAINDTRVELKEARQDLKRILEISLPNLSVAQADEFITVVRRLDAIAAKLP